MRYTLVALSVSRGDITTPYKAPNFITLLTAYVTKPSLALATKRSRMTCA